MGNRDGSLLVLGGRPREGLALALIHISLLHCIHIWVLDGWRGLSSFSLSFVCVCVCVCVYASYLGFCYMHCAGHFCWDIAHPLSYQ